MTRVVHLRERTRKLVRLDPLDAAHLRTLPRRWIRLERIGGNTRYLITVGGIAGTILGPTCRLAIAPKVPLPSLLALLDGESPPATTALPSGPRTSNALLDLVAGAFLHHLRERIRAGLHHGYREQSLASPILQGRLDLPVQIRQGPTRPDVLHQTYDAFTPDVPCNQLLRSAVDALIATPGLDLALRSELRTTDSALADVSALPSSAWQSPLAAPREYATVLDSARLVLGGLAQDCGSEPGVGFVLELERLFERFVVRGLADAAPPGTILEPQARRVLRGRSGPALVVKPDVLVHRAGEVVQVIDAKWKRLRHGRPSRADLYQILAYAETLDIAQATLIYPGRYNRCRRYPLTRRGTQVTIWTVRCDSGAGAFAGVLEHNLSSQEGEG